MNNQQLNQAVQDMKALKEKIKVTPALLVKPLVTELAELQLKVTDELVRRELERYG